MMNTPKKRQYFQKASPNRKQQNHLYTANHFQRPFEIHQLMNQEHRQNDLEEVALLQHLHRHHDGNGDFGESRSYFTRELGTEQRAIDTKINQVRQGFGNIKQLLLQSRWR